uniref:BZIP domain-containing protein n=1 Tax=Panagrolaimus superbus TaxID=310955 RepID=A0A914YRW3_9BILA
MESFQWNNSIESTNSVQTYHYSYPQNTVVPPQSTYYGNPQHNYTRDHFSLSCPTIDNYPTEFSMPQNNPYYPTSTESSPSPTVTNSRKSTCQYPPVRKLTRASSLSSSNCSTPQPNSTSSNGYCYSIQQSQPQQSQQQPQQQQPLNSIIFPDHNPIAALQKQDPSKPLYDGQKRGRKPKSDDSVDCDEEKKLAKRNYGRHYRKNKLLEALKVEEKFKTTKCYMETIKNWANLNGCMELANLVEKHESLMVKIDNFQW